MKKAIYVGLMFTLMLSLTSCSGITKTSKVEKKGVNLAKEYFKEKYDEDLNISDFKVTVLREPTQFPEPPIFAKVENKVFLRNENEDYSIFVNLNSNIAVDDKQTKEIKEDLKEYIGDEYLSKNGIDLEYTIDDRYFAGGYPTYSFSYLDSENEAFDTDYRIPLVEEGFLDMEGFYNGDIKSFIRNNYLAIDVSVLLKADKENYTNDEVIEYKNKIKAAVRDMQEDFTGERSDISILLYKKDKYMNDKVKEIFEKQTTSWSNEDGVIYGPEYVYLLSENEMYNKNHVWEMKMTDYLTGEKNTEKTEEQI